MSSNRVLTKKIHEVEMLNQSLHIKFYLPAGVRLRVMPSC